MSSTEDLQRPERPEADGQTERHEAPMSAAADSARAEHPAEPAAEFAAFARPAAEPDPTPAYARPEPEAATTAPRTAGEPAPDWARVEALRRAPPLVAAAPAPSRSRLGGLAAAGLLLLGSLGGGVAGSVATMAMMPRNANTVQVAPIARQTGTLQPASSTLAPAKSNISAIAREVGPAVVMVLTREGGTNGAR
ncbi:MAG: hypothetical protein NTZ05_18860, partial [Chloroflexi bacterium]|nr:hypothetical protein [Chloroflexota bacterium]